jgi:hypothetical protein
MFDPDDGSLLGGAVSGSSVASRLRPSAAFVGADGSTMGQMNPVRGVKSGLCDRSTSREV